jgi:hypothetical protein
MNPYEELANAIVMSAVKDYRKALKSLRLNSRNKIAMKEAMECEEFFRSDCHLTQPFRRNSSRHHVPS